MLCTHRILSMGSHNSLEKNQIEYGVTGKSSTSPTTEMLYNASLSLAIHKAATSVDSSIAPQLSSKTDAIVAAKSSPICKQSLLLTPAKTFKTINTVPYKTCSVDETSSPSQEMNPLPGASPPLREGSPGDECSAFRYCVEA